VGDFDHETGTVDSFADTGQQIREGRPLGVRVAWSGGGAHFLAVGGYRDLPVQYVHVEDPWYGPSDIPFSTLVGSYQGIGTWTNSYWTKP
jgi:hypothetical protein